MQQDVIIVGAGPAGISAALYTARAGLSTAILSHSPGALFKAERIENYYGFIEPIEGPDLLRRGIAQAQRLGAKILEEEVVSVEYGAQGFTAATHTGQHDGKAVILCTGAPRKAPKIEGLTELEGAGVSYCAICDGFFYKGKAVAVLGCCEYALHEAQELFPLAGSVTLLTNGEKPMEGLPNTLPVYTEPLLKLESENGRLSAALLQSGKRIPIEGLFVAQGVAGSAELARKLGAETTGNRIVVDDHMATTVPGLYAAGDCTGGMLQIAKAVWQGAQAGASTVQFLRKAQ